VPFRAELGSKPALLLEDSIRRAGFDAVSHSADRHADSPAA
jgi:hypothetical protein